MSRIFDWFKEDFEPREKYFIPYAGLLTDDSSQQNLVRKGAAPLRFLEYDWTLNDAPR